ncbi:hypothetical protein [Legionella beliardensis]|nr:hypothetical protein [Legionella beliardensis]
MFYDVAHKSNIAKNAAFFKPPALAISSLSINGEITNEDVDNQEF